MLARAAAEENTSFSALLEMLVIKHCRRRGLITDEQRTIRDLTLEEEAKRQKIRPPFEQKEVRATSA